MSSPFKLKCIRSSVLGTEREKLFALLFCFSLFPKLGGLFPGLLADGPLRLLIRVDIEEKGHLAAFLVVWDTFHLPMLFAGDGLEAIGSLVEPPSDNVVT